MSSRITEALLVIYLCAVVGFVVVLLTCLEGLGST